MSKAETVVRMRAVGEDGATMVEMALACAVLLSAFFAIFEFSIALYSMHYVSEIARDASRYAMVRGSACATDSSSMPDCGFTDTSTTLQNYVQNNLAYPAIEISQVTVTSSWSKPVYSTTSKTPTWTACGTACNDPGDMVTVSVSYPYTLAIPFWKITTMQLTSSSSMVISQ